MRPASGGDTARGPGGICRFPADFTTELHKEYPELIRGTDYSEEMSVRRPPLARARMLVAVAAAAVVALAVAAASFATPGGPPKVARDLAQIYFSTGFVRAEVVTMAGRVEHDYRIDEGRVVAVRQTSIDLLERDGTRQTIGISTQTVITGVGPLSSLGRVA